MVFSLLLFELLLKHTSTRVCLLHTLATYIYVHICVYSQLDQYFLNWLSPGDVERAVP